MTVLKTRLLVYCSSLILGCSLILLISSCGGGSNTETQDPGKYFRLNLTEGISSLDPALAKNQSNTWGINQLFDGLVRLDHNMDIVPALATSWEISEDGMDYTFQLRKGVQFHEHSSLTSREMKASDVVYSFERLLDPKVASTGAWLLNDLADKDSAFLALDDYTFRLRINRPFVPLLSRLSMQYLSIVPEESARLLGKEFRSQPVGTGPFQLVKWREDEFLILKRNEDYWERDASDRQLPYLDGVHFSFQGNKSTEFLQFAKGEYDFVSDLDGAKLKDVLEISGKLKPEFAGKFELIRAPYLNTEYLGILFTSDNPDFENSPLRQRKVRQAINCAIDREKLIENLRQGKGKAAHAGFVPPALLGAADASFGYHYDPARAGLLLSEAGFPGGEGMPEIRLLTTEQYVDICSYVANQLGELGVPVQVERVEGSVHYEMRVKGETEFFRASWIADYADPETYLTCFLGTNGAPPNYTRFANSEFDKLYALAVAETDLSRRMGMYRSLDSLLMVDAPILPLYYDEILRFVQPGVKGLQPNGMNMLDLRRANKN